MSVIVISALDFESLSLNVNKIFNFKILSRDQIASLTELCLNNQSVAFSSWSYNSWLSEVFFPQKLCKSLYKPAVNANQLGFW